MNFALPKPAVYGFLFTALIYLLAVSFISFPLTTVLKPIPILCLIIGVIRAHIKKKEQFFLITALGFSLIGDVILTLDIPKVLELGIACFFLAHCFYIILLLKKFRYQLSHWLYFLPVLLLMIYFLTHLIPFLGSMLIPVLFYFFVLMLMVFSAFQVSEQGILIGIGALCFMCSDLLLAFNLFVYPKIDASVLILLTYYLAQGLLTWGLVKGAQE